MSISRIILILVGLCIFVYLAWPLNGWIIDDAGISFAYSKNIAGGHGMVSQPGVEPVEGISNPLWTFLFVPLFWLKLFSLPWAAKILSILCIGVLLWFLVKICDRLTERSLWASGLVVMATVCSTPIVVWCSSGLENPLYIALTAVLVWVTVRQNENAPRKFMRDAYIAGLITALAALTRPEGIVLASIFPVYLIFSCLLDRQLSIFESLQAFGRFMLSLGFVLGGYLIFRYFYFHDMYPNTYYVKGGPSLAMAIDILWLQGDAMTKFQGIAESFIGFKGRFVLPICVLVCASLALSNRRHRSAILAIAFSAVLTTYTYLLMTNDWMGEFRFASPVYPLVYLTAALAIHQVIGLVLQSSGARIVAGFILAVLLVSAVWMVNNRRLKTFSSHPPTNYFYMARLYGDKFNAYADYLGLESASFLVPDFGGTLMHSRLRLYDLAGLCDRTIPQTREKNQKAFFDYVFDTIKPTFIHTHGFFTEVSKFDDDPRFFRDYMPIYQEVDSYLKRRYKYDRLSGDFVRRDSVVGREHLVDSLLPVVGSRPEFQ
jgi:hypothetical protein